MDPPRPIDSYFLKRISRVSTEPRSVLSFSRSMLSDCMSRVRGKSGEAAREAPLTDPAPLRHQSLVERAPRPRSEEWNILCGKCSSAAARGLVVRTRFFPGGGEVKRQLLCMVALLGLCVSVDLAAASQPEGKLKVYISVDMEGTVGVVTGDQLGPSGFEYSRYREFMTNEALAAVEAAKRAGAVEILVSDSHGNGENLLIEQFPSDVRIIRSWPRRLGMMAGIDASFDAVLLIGYHASTDNPEGVRAHTFSSARLTHVALNGTAVTE